MTSGSMPIRGRAPLPRWVDQAPDRRGRWVGVLVAAVLFALAAGAEIFTTLTFEPLAPEAPLTAAPDAARPEPSP